MARAENAAQKQPKEKPLRKTRPKVSSTVQADPVVQTTAAPLVGTTSGLNLLGVGTDFVGPQGAFFIETAPSDANGSVGATQYVQWVNNAFAVFDKQNGAPVFGPVAGNILWTGFGGPCEANNDGDPIVKWDRIAGRWVLTQLAESGGPPFYQCIAVSKSSDATGSYSRYAFQFSDLNDYPKVSVWPDAYYFSFNLFNGTTFLGAKVCAVDRAQMLISGPATQQCFQLDTNFGAVLPSDLDGATPPPAGSPAFFVGYAKNVLNLWKFHADFANPSSSTLTGPATLPVAPFNEACNDGGTCISQLGTTQQLDSVGDRPMFRLAYRNFGDHEALVLNHSVAAGNVTGVRWYELRDPAGSATVYQQGTYSPDSKDRWMGSIAMDKVGNIALGYSVSSNAMHPSIRYTGRVPSDPLGEMQAENSLYEGTGSQLPIFGSPFSRWGDYSSMAIDPTDDCTFWYTNQYLSADGFAWSTRIGTFNFPSCLAAPSTPDFYLSTSPSSRLAAVGSSAPFTLSVTPTGGFASSVSFSATGLPAGASAGFAPATVSGSGSTTLTITTAPATPPGVYPVTVVASGGGLSHSATVTLTLYVPAVVAFVKSDLTTQGTWKGTYGKDGYAIANNSTSYPPYAQVAFTGVGGWTWASTTADVRGLQKAPPATDRIAATWFAGTSFIIDVNLTDANAHGVAIYCVDWDRLGRAQTVDVLDGTSGAVLDTRSVTNFGNGQYLSWNISGHVQIRVTNAKTTANAVVSGLFFDPPAPPDFSLSATPSSQIVPQGTATAYSVSVSNTLGFAGTVALSATGVPAGATASFNPATLPGSGSSTLTVTTAPATPGGVYPITITGTSGALVHSTTVSLLVAASAPAAAFYVKTDTATQGTWKGTYGKDGWAIPNDSTNYPLYAQVAFTGQSVYTWVASTSDVRAPQKGASTTDRIASTWPSYTSFTIDVNLIDGATHQVGLYCLDWDRLGRTQKMEVLDAASNAVLDTRNFSGMGNGQYAVWNLTGHVKIRITNTAGSNLNAVVSGIFFDISAPDFGIAATPASRTISPGGSTTFTVTVMPTGGFNTAVNLSASGLPAGATAGLDPNSITGTGTSTLTITTTAATPGGVFPITITGTSGALVHSISVNLTIVASAPAAAGFAKTDTTTQGTWKGTYGKDGWAIPNDSTNYPLYAQVVFTGQTSYTWVASTSDVRAPQKGASTTDRIASTWPSYTNFTIDVNLIDGATHQVGLYCLDWDRLGRTQKMEVLDAASNAVLDTRNFSGMGNGQYAVWNLTGHVKIRITNTASSNLNAVVSGIFFDPPGAPDFSVSATPSSQIVPSGTATAYSVSVSGVLGFAGAVDLSATGLPAGATASFTPATLPGSGSSTLTVTTAAATPGGVYPITITGTSGALVHSATVNLVVSASAPTAAAFVKIDTTTQGTWKGTYGKDGWAIANDSTNYAPYAQVVFAGQGQWTWAGSTGDVRALQKAASTTDRIASTWFSATSFTIDINLVDGVTHQVGLYCLDWDRLGRAEKIEILDAATNAVLDTRNLSGIGNGQHVIWNLTGHVKIRITNTAASNLNAVVSGLFFQ